MSRNRLEPEVGPGLATGTTGIGIDPEAGTEGTEEDGIGIVVIEETTTLVVAPDLEIVRIDDPDRLKRIVIVDPDPDLGIGNRPSRSPLWSQPSMTMTKMRRRRRKSCPIPRPMSNLKSRKRRKKRIEEMRKELNEVSLEKVPGLPVLKRIGDNIEKGKHLRPPRPPDLVLESLIIGGIGNVTETVEIVTEEIAIEEIVTGEIATVGIAIGIVVNGTVNGTGIESDKEENGTVNVTKKGNGNAKGGNANAGKLNGGSKNADVNGRGGRKNDGNVKGKKRLYDVEKGLKVTKVNFSLIKSHIRNEFVSVIL